MQLKRLNARTLVSVAEAANKETPGIIHTGVTITLDHYPWAMLAAGLQAAVIKTPDAAIVHEVEPIIHRLVLETMLTEAVYRRLAEGGPDEPLPLRWEVKDLITIYLVMLNYRIDAARPTRGVAAGVAIVDAVESALITFFRTRLERAGVVPKESSLFSNRVD